MDTVEGDDQVIQQMHRFIQECPAKVAQAFAMAQVPITRATLQECPVDTGRLRGSYTLDGPTIAGSDISVVHRYSTDYAFKVHEDLGMRHISPTKAKFLEDPVNQHAPEIPDLMKKGLGRIL
jgi:hypothetical protein